MLECSSDTAREHAALATDLKERYCDEHRGGGTCCRCQDPYLPARLDGVSCARRAWARARSSAEDRSARVRSLLAGLRRPDARRGRVHADIRSRSDGRVRRRSCLPPAEGFLVAGAGSGTAQRLGTWVVRLILESGELVRLRAPTCTWRSNAARYERDFHSIGECWLAHRGQSWRPLCPEAPRMPVAR